MTDANGKRSLVKPSSRWALAFFVALMLFTLLQTILFKTQALPVTTLLIQEAVGKDSFQLQAKLLKICQQVKATRCVERSARRILVYDPTYIPALGSLAVTMCRQGECEKAGNYFLSYFGEGGTATDVMYWYGRYFKQQGDMDSANKWFQQAKGVVPSDIKGAL